MYASIRRYEGVERETAIEVARRGYSELREQLSRRAGFVAYEIVVGDNSIASISVFETWVTAEESNATAAKWVRENLAGLEWPEPQITAGQIYETPGST